MLYCPEKDICFETYHIQGFPFAHTMHGHSALVDIQSCSSSVLFLSTSWSFQSWLTSSRDYAGFLKQEHYNLAVLEHPPQTAAAGSAFGKVWVLIRQHPSMHVNRRRVRPGYKKSSASNDFVCFVSRFGLAVRR